MDKRIYDAVWRFTVSYKKENTNATAIDVYSALLNEIDVDKTDVEFAREIFECIENALKYGEDVPA